MAEKKINLFGLNINDINMGRALALSSNALSGGKRISVFTPNLEMLSGAWESVSNKRMLNSASILLPDGFGLRAAAFLAGKKLENTVAGIDYGERLMALAAKRGCGVFLLGGGYGVAEKAGSRLETGCSGVEICGTHHGYFEKGEEWEICERIKESGAEILIVCMGFPRQERFVCRVRGELSQIRIFACLGGAIDVWSGEKARAPMILRRARLEWLYRVCAEPIRLPRLAASLVPLPSAVWEERKKDGVLRN